MVNKNESIDFSKINTVEEVRNSEAYKSWVKEVKEKHDDKFENSESDEPLEAYHIF